MSRKKIQSGTGVHTRLREVVGAKWGAIQTYAEKIGVPRQTLNRYLTGSRTPPLDLLSRVAEHEGVSLDWLIRGEGVRYRNASSVPPIVRDMPIMGRVPAGPPGGAYWSEYDAPGVLEELAGVDDPHSIALRVRGESMWPTLLPDDLVVMSPSTAWREGDLVVAEIHGNSDDYQVKRLGSSSCERTVLISDNFLAFEPLELPAGEVKIRGRVVRVIRTPSRREPRTQGEWSLVEFYRDPKIQTILERLQGLSEKAREIVIQHIELLAKAEI